MPERVKCNLLLLTEHPAGRLTDYPTNLVHMSQYIKRTIVSNYTVADVTTVELSISCLPRNKNNGTTLNKYVWLRGKCSEVHTYGYIHTQSMLETSNTVRTDWDRYNWTASAYKIKVRLKGDDINFRRKTIVNGFNKS